MTLFRRQSWRKIVVANFALLVMILFVVVSVLVVVAIQGGNR